MVLATQTLSYLHPTISLDKNWYLATWIVSNTRQDAPDNANFFPGLGYRTDDWWTEALMWKQWSKKRDTWGIDGRFGLSNPKLLLYVELGITLATRDLFLFVSSEYPMGKKWKVGVETENFRRAQGLFLGAGPRLSYVWGKFASGPVVTTLAYQMRRNESDIIQLYLVIHPRL